MTESNLPAVREEQPRDVARADTDSWTDIVGDVAKFAGYICGTDFVPRSLRDSPAAATAAIMFGREVGLPPMTSLIQTHVIEGRPSMAAEAMRALVMAAGHDIEVLETTGAICRMRGRRRGSERWSPDVVWTIDMARAAGLLTKSNWSKWPRRMLQARATSELCELYFPDVVLGFKSIEEMEDEGGAEAGPVQALVGETTKVTRKRTTAKRTAAALPAPEKPAQRPDGPTGPPLPGEAGFEDESGQQAAQEPAGEVGTDDAGSSSHDEPRGNDTEEPTTPAAEAGEPGEDAADVPPAGDPGSPEPQAEDRPEPGPRKASKAQHRMIFGSLNNLYGEDSVPDEERLLIASTIVGRPIASFNDLLNADAKKIIDTLARCKDRAQLMNLLDTIDEATAQEQAAAEGDDDGDGS